MACSTKDEISGTVNFEDFVDIMSARMVRAHPRDAEWPACCVMGGCRHVGSRLAACLPARCHLRWY